MARHLPVCARARNPASRAARLGAALSPSPTLPESCRGDGAGPSRVGALFRASRPSRERGLGLPMCGERLRARAGAASHLPDGRSRTPAGQEAA